VVHLRLVGLVGRCLNHTTAEEKFRFDVLDALLVDARKTGLLVLSETGNNKHRTHIDLFKLRIYVHTLDERIVTEVHRGGAGVFPSRFA
jgi:hypothetical protein